VQLSLLAAAILFSVLFFPAYEHNKVWTADHFTVCDRKVSRSNITTGWKNKELLGKIIKNCG